METSEDLKELGIHSKRIPSFVLPDSHVPIDSHNSEDGRAALPHRSSVRDKMRPDMMMVEMTDEETTRYLPHDANTGQALPSLSAKMPNGTARKIHILEVGYCNDVSYLKKLKEKEMQHSRQP